MICLFLLFHLQLVTSYHPPKSQFSSAMKVCNQSKNRSPDLLATDTSRVFLNPTSEQEGADYINASWLTGAYSSIIKSSV